MSAVSGNCERCIKLGLAGWCSGNRDDCTKKLLDTIESQQQENEQLRAQVARMREALIKSEKTIGLVFEQLEHYEPGWYTRGMYNRMIEALAEIDKAIGGESIDKS